jgi:DNA-binding response OmpR family regulator
MQRIAIVEDDRTTLAVFADVLRAGGFQVLPFSTGEAALAALGEAPVDLMVVDLLLPRMSGIDLVREVRALSWAAATPILAITALRWSPEQVAAIVEAMSPAQLLRKPIRPADFLATVQAALANGLQPAGWPRIQGEGEQTWSPSPSVIPEATSPGPSVRRPR